MQEETGMVCFFLIRHPSPNHTHNHTHTHTHMHTNSFKLTVLEAELGEELLGDVLIAAAGYRGVGARAALHLLLVQLDPGVVVLL